MYTVLRSEQFDKWLKKLKDVKGKVRIIARIRAVELGNLGDIKSVGNGISEMRIHSGPGYRVYFTRKSQILILLLIAGTKSSQKKDILRAETIAARLKD